MRNKVILGIMMAVLAVSGCYTARGYQPTVDPYGDPRADRIGQDLYECQALASQASGGTAKRTAEGAVVGGLVGAAAGAAVGAAVGDPGTGAALGAATGGFGGGLSEAGDAELTYKRAYQNCMRNRGHNVLD